VDYDSYDDKGVGSYKKDGWLASDDDDSIWQQNSTSNTKRRKQTRTFLKKQDNNTDQDDEDMEDSDTKFSDDYNTDEHDSSDNKNSTDSDPEEDNQNDDYTNDEEDGKEGENDSDDDDDGDESVPPRHAAGPLCPAAVHGLRRRAARRHLPGRTLGVARGRSSPCSLPWAFVALDDDVRNTQRPDVRSLGPRTGLTLPALCGLAGAGRCGRRPLRAGPAP